MRKKNWIVGVIVLVIIILVMLGMSGRDASAPQQEKGDIRIGSILIFSGEGASYGEASRNGITLAVNDINKNGGVDGRKLVVTYEDDASQPQKAVSAFNKLTNEGIKFIIGPNWVNTSTAVTPLATEKKVVMISPSQGGAAFNEASKYLFSMRPHDATLSSDLADYAYGKGSRKVAVLGANDLWVKDQTNTFHERFEKIGGKVVVQYEPLTSETDVRTTLLKIKNDKTIDSIILTTDGYGLTSTFAKQLKQLSINLPVYAITIDQQSLNNCQGTCDGFTMLTALTPTKAFSDMYAAAYKKDVEIGSDSAYDAVMLLARAIRETKSTDPDIVAAYMASVKTINGMSGILTSDGKRSYTKPYLVTKIVQGKPVQLK